MSSAIFRSNSTPVSLFTERMVRWWHLGVLLMPSRTTVSTKDYATMEALAKLASDLVTPKNPT
ncbi:hypothetical protein PI124_g12932 [Phytophthora idaei]|nr:hypothetical protein PI125_g11270 [Phytophthora idaei]KAG3149918.1 hypothetical protein PI126_g11785 [Phytophthora idaei]KAG3242220.1 hypothetical protein PI124_g12932 [Phytophthora idaei]